MFAKRMRFRLFGVVTTLAAVAAVVKPEARKSKDTVAATAFHSTYLAGRHSNFESADSATIIGLLHSNPLLSISRGEGSSLSTSQSLGCASNCRGSSWSRLGRYYVTNEHSIFTGNILSPWSTSL